MIYNNTIYDTVPPIFLNHHPDLQLPPPISGMLMISGSSGVSTSILEKKLPELNKKFCKVGLWKKDFGFRITDNIPSWAGRIQYQRWSILAISRNHLLFRALDNEDWVLWLDVYMIEYPAVIGDMPWLYAAATYYWSMSHGEGWDLCMMEVGAAGLHLIAPDHSSYTVYLNSLVADMIPSKKIPASFRWAQGLHKLFQDAEWWQPDETIAADYICQALDDRNTKKIAMAQSLITKKFTWQKATLHLIEILSELEKSV